MFSWFTDRVAGRNGSSQDTQMAKKLYASIVAQARQPVFYRELGVADTVPGRFEVISLHMFIVLDRLSKGSQGGEDAEKMIAQKLVDVMFQDMDDVARETGVGDMGVGPRIKKLARSFQSRLQYYKETIEGDAAGEFTRGTLPEALIEIHFNEDKSLQSKADQLANYVLSGQARIADMSVSEMTKEGQLFGKL